MDNSVFAVRQRPSHGSCGALMACRPFLLFAATLLVTGTFGSAAARAQERELPATLIVACDHSGGSELVTRVSGVEWAGRVPDRVVAALGVESSCAAAFNLLVRADFELVHRLVGLGGDFDGDSDVDGRDFLIWQRGNLPAPAQPSARVATVLLKCDYQVSDGLATRVTGSEIAGAIPPALAAALATGPSCSGAWALLAGAGMSLVSGAPAPGDVDGSDFTIWRSRFGSGG